MICPGVFFSFLLFLCELPMFFEFACFKAQLVMFENVCLITVLITRSFSEKSKNRKTQ